MSDVATYLVTLFGCLLISGSYSGSETGYYALNRIRLRHRLANDDPRAYSLNWFVQRPRLFIFTILVGNNIVNFLASFATTQMFMDVGVSSGRVHLVWGVVPWNAELATTYLVTPLFFIFGEVGPKNLFRSRANALMYRLTGFMRFSVVLLYPATLVLRFLTGFLRQAEDSATSLEGLTRQRLRGLFSESVTEGTVTHQQNDMVMNTLSMRGTPVTRVMIPIQRAVRASVSTRLRDLPALLRGRAVSRLLIYRDNIHDVVGIVHFLDLIDLEQHGDETAEVWVRPSLRVSRKHSLQQAFYRMREHHQPLALVVDDNKRCIGLVSLEDVARHVVGMQPRGPAPAPHHQQAGGKKLPAT